MIARGIETAAPSPFTPEQQRRFDEGFEKAVAKYPPDRRRSALLAVLHLAQDELGWLSEPAMAYVGWRLDVSSLRLGKSGVAGLSWFGTASSGLFPTYCLQPTRPSVVTVTAPDGKVYEFEPTLSRSCQFAIPLEETTVGYQPRPGTVASTVRSATITSDFCCSSLALISASTFSSR